jgi:hypothetical protein
MVLTDSNICRGVQYVVFVTQQGEVCVERELQHVSFHTSVMIVGLGHLQPRQHVGFVVMCRVPGQVWAHGRQFVWEVWLACIDLCAAHAACLSMLLAGSCPSLADAVFGRFTPTLLLHTQGRCLCLCCVLLKQ